MYGMRNSLSLRLSTNRLRRACAQIPAWVATGISGAEGEEGGDGGTGSGGTDTETPRERALREEKERHYQKAQAEAAKAKEAADKLAEAEKRLKEIEDKDKSETEKAKSDAEAALKAKEAADARIAELEKLQEDNQVQLAFLGNAKYTWHNPATALKLLDRSDVKIENGEVKGLDKAIDKLAKEEAYLVKTANGQQNNGQNNGQQNGTGAAGNGGSTRNGQGSGTPEQRKQELQAKYNIPR